MKKIIIVESIRYLSKSTLSSYLKRGIPVFILESFIAYHKVQDAYYDGVGVDLPPSIQLLVKNGAISLYMVDGLDPKSIYWRAADQAVDSVEEVYAEYRRRHRKLINFTVKTLKSPVAENVFKIHLCDSLAKFYSCNLLIERLKKENPDCKILYFPSLNPLVYDSYKSLLKDAGHSYFDDENVLFAIEAYRTAKVRYVKEAFKLGIQLLGQSFISSLASVFPKRKRLKKVSYTYGVGVVSPHRQFSNNRRTPDFLVDDQLIKKEDVIYFPVVKLSQDLMEQLKERCKNVIVLPQARKFFSNGLIWWKLFFLGVVEGQLKNAEELKNVSLTFFQYFRWSYCLESVGLKHFITHADFGVPHIGRNIALSQHGVKTWYFTDSSNHGCTQEGIYGNCRMRHPYWVYLFYDCFVTWNELTTRFYKSHPGNTHASYIVGCLWSQHIRESSNGGYPKDNFSLDDEMFHIAAFDTSFTPKGFASFEEGLAFIEDLIKLVDADKRIQIVLKGKKSFSNPFWHVRWDPRLDKIYQRLIAHPQVKFFDEDSDSSRIIADVDCVVSFPFTSPTFEALSLNKPAVWHDPLGQCRHSIYGEVGGVMTHSFEELHAFIKNVRNLKNQGFQNPVPKDSPLLDPFRDGRAIDRFRELLKTL